MKNKNKLKKKKFVINKKNFNVLFLVWWSCNKPNLLAGTTVSSGKLELQLLFLHHIISDAEIKSEASDIKSGSWGGEVKATVKQASYL